MNTAWHQANPEPRGGSLDKKVNWHQEHMAVCGCTQPPGAILVELERRERRGKKRKFRR